jgi:leader peptidase (prepilin peptidase)/N-methyltransferase
LTWDYTATDAGFVGIFALLGLLIGSFLNVVIHRLPRMMERQWQAELAEMAPTAAIAPLAPLTPSGPGPESAQPLTLLTPRSHCPNCGHVLRWYENIPVLSYLALRGRCAACPSAISLRYPLVELLTALLFAWCAARAGSTQLPLAWAWCIFCALLLALALIDLDHHLLPDSLTQPLLWTGLGGAALGWTGTALSTAFWGAAAGYLSLWLLATLFRWITGRVGMGQGDFKLFAALGAWLGWAALPPLLLLASTLGALVGLVMLWRRQRATASERDAGSNAEPDADTNAASDTAPAAELPETEAPLYIPFGPFLALAGLALMGLGPELILTTLGLPLPEPGLVLK